MFELLLFLLGLLGGGLSGLLGIGGGIMKPHEGPWPAKLTVYIDVDDLDAARERIIAAGGTMVVDPMQVPGVGAMALFEDPDGRVIGLWKQPPATGSG